MSKYRFSKEQSFAIWRVYERKCFYCKQPLTFQETTIDHVLPESLLQKPDDFSKIKAEYGLSNEFVINDYCNWVPSHQHCNRDKSDFVASKTPAFIQILDTVQNKGEKARREEKRIIENLKKGELLGKLGIALKRGILTPLEISDFLKERSSARDEYEPIVISFVMKFDKLLSEGIPANIGTSYAELCDWLEKDLIKDLSSVFSCSFYYPEASQRTGETLSLRLAFVQLNISELDQFTNSHWEIAEVQYFSELYGESAWIQERHNQKLKEAPIIDDSEFIRLLHSGGLLVCFQKIVGNDYRAVISSQDYSLYQSDSYYDLEMWCNILESAGVEEWEIEQAMAKSANL